MASEAKLDAAAAAEADLLLEEEKKSQSKKRKNTSKKVFEVLHFSISFLNLWLTGCKNEWSSWHNRKLQRASLVLFLRLLNSKYLKNLLRMLLNCFRVFSEPNGFLLV